VRRRRERGIDLGASYARRRVIIGWILLSTGLAFGLAAASLERWGVRRVDDEARYDAIVVAGCAVRPDGTPSPALANRTAHAVALHRRGLAPKVVFTGGVGTHAPSEAEAASRHAIALGLPADAVLLEAKSTSTEENARFAAEILGAEARVLVVSDAYHVFRCERVFGRYFEGARGSGSLGRRSARLQGAFREVVAVAAYGVLGRL
tara:strand:- start:96 stop:713 length:618 start_codon:yes stop_codon:yes gene_type:complete